MTAKLQVKFSQLPTATALNVTVGENAVTLKTQSYDAAANTQAAVTIRESAVASKPQSDTNRGHAGNSDGS